MEVETSWLIDELLFPGDDDRNDEVRARGCLRECSIEHDGTDDREMACKEVAAHLRNIADEIDKEISEITSRAAEVLVAFLQNLAEKIDKENPEITSRAAEVLVAFLQNLAEKIDKENPEITSRAAEVLVASVTDSSTEGYQKFEEAAWKAIRLVDPDTSTELSGFATVYRIGKQVLTMLGLDSPFRRVAGACLKKFLDSRVGTVVAKNEKGEWTMKDPTTPV
jgi:hemerythrin-like domain-containing protein